MEPQHAIKLMYDQNQNTFMFEDKTPTKLQYQCHDHVLSVIQCVTGRNYRSECNKES